MLLSLFIGAITIGMQSSLEDAKEEKALLEGKRIARERQEVHSKLAESGCVEIRRLWRGGDDANDVIADETEGRSRWVVQYIYLSRRCRRVAESAPFNHGITCIILVASLMVRAF